MSGHSTPRVPPARATALPNGTTPIASNFVFGPTQYLASQALPAAGAFTALQTKAVPLGAKRVTYFVSYSRGAAGGYPIFRPYSFAGSGGTVQGRSVVLDLSSFAAVGQEGATKFYVEELKGPPPDADGPLLYKLTFLLEPYTTFIDLQVAEGGAPGTPGTIAINFTGEG